MIFPSTFLQKTDFNMFGTGFGNIEKFARFYLRGLNGSSHNKIKLKFHEILVILTQNRPTVIFPFSTFPLNNWTK